MLRPHEHRILLKTGRFISPSRLVHHSLNNCFVINTSETFPSLTNGVKINKLQVPEVAQFGSPVVLDCDYSWDEKKDDGLVVKWFFNNGRTPIYQWITNNKPQALGILKGRLNLEYSASQHNNSKHRALHITKPAPELSGDYTCSVSSFNDEDSRTKSMLVYVPERSLNLRQERSSSELMRVSCSAEGVYPQPEMMLLQGDSFMFIYKYNIIFHITEKIEINNTVITVEKKEGLFNIKATSDQPRLEAAKEFSCELRIPKANYTVKKEVVYYPNSRGSNFESSSVVITTILWFILDTFSGSIA
ncbi:uncharacterized protein LOC108734222 isoform X2 [Agrilus planipennis]|uniref:Uncharacterized protein LOC108734222 isoform X2 n=1 Tax=Agrilus planipennis TaxID=224129 RepID=A0A1W4WM37_AGRPL|nr:uncharacterized protein LOC108734222 isoform X2 [Agrilus planipennis]